MNIRHEPQCRLGQLDGGWAPFFLVTIVAAVPALLLIYRMPIPENGLPVDVDDKVLALQ